MMGYMFDTLPLFAADYSAAASTVREMDGLAIILCPDGCMGNFTRFDDMMWMDDPGNVLQLELREMDVIFGDVRITDTFAERIRDLNPRFTAIINTPVSALVGIDTESMAKSMSEKTGIPAISVRTSGYNTYQDGISGVLERVLPQLEPNPSDEAVVGVLGFNCLDNTREDAAIKQADELNIYLEGEHRMLSLPDFSSLGRARDLLGTLSDSGMVAGYVNEMENAAREAGSDDSYMIRIGQEITLEGLDDCSFITATYNLTDSVSSNIGVIGPKRMLYSKVISQIDFVKKKLNEEMRRFT